MKLYFFSKFTSFRCVADGVLNYIRYLLIIISICVISVNSNAKLIIGSVRDASTNQPIPFTNVYIYNSKESILTDSLGLFAVPISKKTKITAKCLGYLDNTITVLPSQRDTLVFLLTEKTQNLDEIVVRPKKEKYSKKNNPAVELMLRVKNDYKKTDPFLSPDYSYEKYSKTLLGGNEFNVDFNNLSKFQKNFKFLEQFVDTAPWTGARILDLALMEKNSIRITSSALNVDKEIVTGLSERGINQMFEAENVRIMFDDILREIDVHNNDIYLLQNKFVSPLSNIAPDFYKFHLTDTVYFGGDHCIELSFAPKSPESFGFNGKLFIPLNDSVKYIKRLTMRAPKAMNLNYIDNIFISQNFEKDSLGKVHKVLDDVCLEIKIVKFAPPVYALRQTRYGNFNYSHMQEYSDYYSTLGNYFEVDSVNSQPASFWESKRRVPFSYAENNLLNLVPNLRKVKLVYWSEKILRILFQGYVGTLPENSKFDIGPVNTFISYNDLEGLRLKLGGMSTSSLSDRFFFRGYGAYGFKDHKWKYMGELEYSFIKKKKHSREFPMNAIRATYKFDTNAIGVRYLYTNPDNVVLSIRRKKNDLIIYKELAQLEYNLELRNNLSFNFGYRNEKEIGNNRVIFTNGYGESFKNYRIGAFFAQIRFAPGEKFVQGTSNRRPVNMDAPIFTISHEYGPKNFLGADFTMNRTEFSFSKRFWFSAFGYTNLLIKAGKIWSQVPFPSLLWQNANLSYTIQQETFSLLNPMEFATDQFASWDMEYFINGAILNRIPYIKKAKLREIISFKGFFGGLSKRNNPEYNKSLYEFPKNAHTQLMGKTPYMEIGVGLDNIFTILRVDYVWRLTYRHNPDISKSGIRVSLHLSF